MKIIGVTGGTGFIGQYLLREYADKYKFIIATSKDKTDYFYQHKNIEYVYSDYNEQSLMETFVNCNAIVHLAAKRPTTENEESVENYFSNITLAEILFNVCNNLGITNIVNISSRSVYGLYSTTPNSENQAANPYNYYGASKLFIENIAEILNKKYSLKIKSLRLAQVIGIGERDGFMLSTFLNNCLSKEPINIYGEGKSAREYVYVKDVCRSIICALNRNNVSGVFNIGSGYSISNMELAKLFCEVFHNSAGIKMTPVADEIIYRIKLDINLAKNLLKFEPKYTVKDALIDMKNILEDSI